MNTLSFAIFTWYSLVGNSDSNKKAAAAYTSVTLTIIVLLLIILYHVYTFTTILAKVKKTKLGRMIDWLFTETQSNPNPRQRHFSPPPDDDIHRFDELLDDLNCPVNTDDYKNTLSIPLLRPTPAEPTFSVVELPKLRDLNTLKEAGSQL